MTIFPRLSLVARMMNSAALFLWTFTFLPGEPCARMKDFAALPDELVARVIHVVHLSFTLWLPFDFVFRD